VINNRPAGKFSGVAGAVSCVMGWCVIFISVSLSAVTLTETRWELETKPSGAVISRKK
jgi:hypothetical protein